MNKNDCSVLYVLYDGGYFNSLKSVTASEISRITKLGGTKIRKVLNEFKDSGYVEEGLKKAQARTFYITDSGIEFLKKTVYPNTLEELSE